LYVAAIRIEAKRRKASVRPIWPTADVVVDEYAILAGDSGRLVSLLIYFTIDVVCTVC
jgi:hypothetical protein